MVDLIFFNPERKNKMTLFPIKNKADVEYFQRLILRSVLFIHYLDWGMTSR